MLLLASEAIKAAYLTALMSIQQQQWPLEVEAKWWVEMRCYLTAWPKESEPRKWPKLSWLARSEWEQVANEPAKVNFSQFNNNNYNNSGLLGTLIIVCFVSPNLELYLAIWTFWYGMIQAICRICSQLNTQESV